MLCPLPWREESCCSSPTRSFPCCPQSSNCSGPIWWTRSARTSAFASPAAACPAWPAPTTHPSSRPCSSAITATSWTGSSACCPITAAICRNRSTPSGSTPWMRGNRPAPGARTTAVSTWTPSPPAPCTASASCAFYQYSPRGRAPPLASGRALPRHGPAAAAQGAALLAHLEPAPAVPAHHQEPAQPLRPSDAGAARCHEGRRQLPARQPPVDRRLPARQQLGLLFRPGSPRCSQRSIHAGADPDGGLCGIEAAPAGATESAGEPDRNPPGLTPPRPSVVSPRDSGGPGAAVVPHPLAGPQRSGPSTGSMLGFIPHSFPPRKRGPRSRGGAAATKRTSAQRIFRRQDAWDFLKEQHAPCCGNRGGPMSFWLPPSAPWSLRPAARRDYAARDRAGPGAAVVPHPLAGPQRSGPSTGTMLGFIPHSFPPRKRGPRSRGGAAATERTSTQRAFHRQDAWVLMKRRHPLCCGNHGGLMSFWLPPSAPWSLGPGVRRENEE